MEEGGSKEEKKRGGFLNKRACDIIGGETFCFEEPVTKSFLKAVSGTYREQLEERSTRLFFNRKNNNPVLFSFTNSDKLQLSVCEDAVRSSGASESRD